MASIHKFAKHKLRISDMIKFMKELQQDMKNRKNLN